MTTEALYRCYACKTQKPIAKMSSNGPRRPHRCKACSKAASADYRRRHPDYARQYMAARRKANPEKERRYKELWQAAHPDWARKSHLKLNYNLSMSDYKQLHDSQNGLCAICKQPERKYKYLAVDHDHNTGHIRGLLCASCNNVLGLVKDDPRILSSAIAYLQHTHMPNSSVSDVPLQMCVTG